MELVTDPQDRKAKGTHRANYQLDKRSLPNLDTTLSAAYFNILSFTFPKAIRTTTTLSKPCKKLLNISEIHYINIFYSIPKKQISEETF